MTFPPFYHELLQMKGKNSCFPSEYLKEKKGKKDAVCFLSNSLILLMTCHRISGALGVIRQHVGLKPLWKCVCHLTVVPQMSCTAQLPIR